MTSCDRKHQKIQTLEENAVIILKFEQNAEEQIRWVFDDKLGIIFNISP